MIGPEDIQPQLVTPDVPRRCDDCPALCILQERLDEAQKVHRKLIKQLEHASAHPEEIEEFAKLLLSSAQIPDDQYDQVLREMQQMLGSGVDDALTQAEESITHLTDQINELPNSCEGTLTDEKTDSRLNVYDIGICTSDALYREYGSDLHAPAHVLSHSAVKEEERKKAIFFEVISALGSFTIDDTDDY